MSYSWHWVWSMLSSEIWRCGSLIEVRRRLGGTYSLHIQGRKFALLPNSFSLVAWIAYSQRWRWGQDITQNAAIFLQDCTASYLRRESLIFKNTTEELVWVLTCQSIEVKWKSDFMPEELYSVVTCSFENKCDKLEWSSCRRISLLVTFLIIFYINI
jgi:hypothetical protein